MKQLSGRRVIEAEDINVIVFGRENNVVGSRGGAKGAVKTAREVADKEVDGGGDDDSGGNDDNDYNN